MKSKLMIGLIFASILTGCSKDDEEDTNKVVNDPQIVTLISPNKTIHENPCCINFSWQSFVQGNSRLVVSEDSSFTNLIVDTTIASQSFNLDYTFKPATKYYWRVSKSEGMQGASFFTVKDVLSTVQGTYSNALIRKYNWSGPTGIENDTIFTGTVKLQKEGSKIRMQYLFENINQVMEYAPQNIANSVIYITNPYGSNGATLALNYVNDSIIINNKFGGLGGGTVWIMKMKK